MIAPILNLFRVEEIRKRIFVTLGLLFVYRIGSQVPLPGVDFTALEAFLRRSADKTVGDIVARAPSGANLQKPSPSLPACCRTSRRRSSSAVKVIPARALATRRGPAESTSTRGS
jgi:hypothetical protein